MMEMVDRKKQNWANGGDTQSSVWEKWLQSLPL
jgi:hypothetical protein